MKGSRQKLVFYHIMHLWASVQVLCILCFAYDVCYQVHHGIACLEDCMIACMLYACMYVCICVWCMYQGYWSVLVLIRKLLNCRE